MKLILLLSALKKISIRATHGPNYISPFFLSENSDDLSSSGAPSTLDLNVLINSVLNPQGPFEWEHVLHKNSFPVVVQFPSIPSAVGMSDSSNFKSSSFKSSHSVSKMPVTILKNVSTYHYFSFSERQKYLPRTKESLFIKINTCMNVYRNWKHWL